MLSRKGLEINEMRDKMKVLVIGGTRFMGPHVVNNLLSMGHDVKVFHRGKSNTELPSNVEHIYGDRANIGDYGEQLTSYQPDVVLDMIALKEDDALKTIAAFEGLKTRFVLISSQDVYRVYGRLIGTEPGPPDPVPFTETSPLREKLFPYRGDTWRLADDPKKWMDFYDKILVEKVYRQNVATTILRLPAVYGPGDGQHRIYEYLKRMDDNRPAIIVPKSMSQWRWTRGYVEDIAYAITQCVVSESSAGKVYNIGESKALTTIEWIDAIAEAAGWNGEIVVLDDNDLPRHLVANIIVNQHMFADTNKIVNDLGVSEVVSQQEALKRTIKWERKHPPQNMDKFQFNYKDEDKILQQLKENWQ